MQEFRNFSVAGVSTAGLKQSRFPFIGVTSPVGPHMAYSFSFSQYAERTYDVRTTDTVMLRGAPVGVTDRAASSGGVADVQVGLAWARDPKLSFGMAGHLLTGSAKVSTTREFTDPFYRSFTDNVDATFGGFGLSAGLVASPSTALHLGASVRMDTRLERRVAGQNLGEVKLPVTASAGVEIRFSPALRLASTGIWRSWSGATADLASAGTRAFDTFDWGLGVDLGGARGGPPLPLRLGLRYATLPFSPNGEQPKELALSAGTTASLARGRAHFDVAAERVMRDGGGLEEKAWQITLGFTVRP
jgi:hypothetical protein